MQAFTAAAVYGVPVSPQPNAAPMATQPAGQPEPTMRTQPRAAHLGALGDPILVLVALVGLAFFVLHVSVRGSVSVGVS